MTVGQKCEKSWTVLLKTSSIHGLKYLVTQSKIRYQRIFWCMLMSIVSGIISYLVYRTTTKYLQDQIVISNPKRQYSITEIYHPALTICPELKISVKNISDEKKIYEIFDDTNFQPNFDFNMSSLKFELEKRSQFEWFTECVGGSFASESEISLSPIVLQHGICFTFNMQPANLMLNLDKVSENFHFNNTVYLKHRLTDVYEQEETPLKPFDSIKNVALNFRRKGCKRDYMQSGYFDIAENKDPSMPDYDDSNIFQPLEGILGIVHHPDEYPVNTGQSLYILYWSNNQWTFYPEVNLISDELKSWPLKKRNCYLPDEKNLKFFKIYTKNNCEHECLSNLILEKCGCVPFYMIRGPSSALCGIRDKRCVSMMKQSYDNMKDQKANCECLNLCEHVDFEVKAINRLGIMGYTPTEMKTRFASEFFIPIIKQVAVGNSSYLGSIGGLMGLFAGMSIISIAETAFFIIQIATTKSRKRKLQKKTHKIIIVAPKNLTRERKPKKKVLRQSVDFFIGFIKKSDIHGLRHIVKKKNGAGHKFLWLMTVLFSSATCILLIFNLIENSTTNPIEFAIDQKLWDVKDIPFPQITFCPGLDTGKYDQEKACIESKICDDIEPERVRILQDPIKGPEELKAYAYLYKKGSDEKSEEKKFAEKGFYTKFGPDVLNKLRTFSLLHRIENQSFCSSEFREVKINEVLTQTGVCFTFNSNEKLMRVREAGSDFAGTKIYNTVCNDKTAILKTKTLTIDIKNENESKGTKSLLYNVHNKDEAYESARSFFSPSTHTKVILRPKITTTDENLRKFDPKIRNCYFSDEKRLKYFTKYSRSYCLDEVLSLFMQKYCGCVFFYLPRNDSQRICDHQDDSCHHEFIHLKFESDEFKSSSCLPECDSIDYNYEVISEKMKPERNASTKKIYYSASIYFGSDEFIAYKRFESYGAVKLLSNIGGLLGLFLGLSLLSVIEIVYFFTLRLFNDLFCKTSS